MASKYDALCSRLVKAYGCIGQQCIPIKREAHDAIRALEAECEKWIGRAATGEAAAEDYDHDGIDMRYQRDAAEARAKNAERELNAAHETINILRHLGESYEVRALAAEKARDALGKALRELVFVCEQDFTNEQTEITCRDDDASSIGGGEDGDMALTFGHIRRGRSVLVALGME
jgi:hypothetical protein